MSTDRTSRTWLFVPGDRPDRFAKAGASGADEVICDLEDAVAPESKEPARADVRAWLADAGSAWVRVNAVDTRWHDDDVAALRDLPGLKGIVVPKAEAPGLLRAIRDRLGDGVGLIALIETAAGVHHVHDVAACGAVDRLAFGSIDFALDIDAAESDEALLLARSALVLASRVAGLPAPIDGVTTALTDTDAVHAAARHARDLGFGGKLCVHPAQIEPVAEAFRPTAAEVQWAEAIVRSVGEAGSGASAADGALIDQPVLERARRLLQHTEQPT